jgi:intracellular septation protein A
MPGDPDTRTDDDTHRAGTAPELSAEDHAGAPGQAAPQGGNRLDIAIAVADLVVPIGGYYLLRACGVGELAALLISSIPPLLSFLIQVVAFRRVDSFSIFIAVVLVLSGAAALTTLDPRALLARDGWIMGLAGVYFLSSLWAKRPICYSIARPLAEGRIGPPGMSWDTVWETYPLFRRVWRVLTIVWGVGLITDAAVRVVIAYTLPVDVVPALTGVQYVVVYAILQIITQVYLRRSGIMQLPGFDIPRRKGWSRRKKATATT